MTTESQLDTSLRELWQVKDDSTASLRHAAQVARAALAASIEDPLLMSRCLAAMELLPESSPAIMARIEEFRLATARRILRTRQVDQIGDIHTEPEAIFGILGDELVDYDITEFEPDKLHTARVALKERRYEAARAFLSVFGEDNLPSETLTDLLQAADHLRSRAERYAATALFTARDGAGLALGVKASRCGGDAIVGYTAADAKMKIQAEAVLRQEYGSGIGVGWDVEWEIDYGGSSIGLALLVAARVEKGLIPPDPLLACTGRISAGSVVGVEGIIAKIQAAAAAGYRRVLVPTDNEAEARSAAEPFPALTVYTISHADDLTNVLASLSGAVPVGVDGTALFIRKLIPLYRLELVGERALPNGRRLEVEDSLGRANIDIFTGRKGTVCANGKPDSTGIKAAQRLIDERLPGSRIQRRGGVTCVLPTEARQSRFRTEIERAGATSLPLTNPYVKWRYEIEDGSSKASVVGYTSNKVVVNPGTAPAHDIITQALDDALAGLGGVPTVAVQSTEQPTADNTRAAEPSSYVPHIGTDEAGKGDYFGPLVCAACYVDEAAAQTLRELGAQDSKKLSDKRVRMLAGRIRELLPGSWRIVIIQPRRYNELVAQFKAERKNLNSLVAWGHARTIKDLVIDHRAHIDYVVIDKFADERYIVQHLRSDSRAADLNLDLRVKGESDIAVAAASILARDAFVQWLDKQSAQLGMPLPKGAGEQVIAAARDIVARHGAGALTDLAKLSFRTTEKVMGGAHD